MIGSAGCVVVVLISILLEGSDRLRRSGIDYAQGFHIGMPRPIVEAFAPQ
jgi:hypothetical protein